MNASGPTAAEKTPARRTAWLVVGAVLLFAVVMIGVYFGSRQYVIRRAEKDIETMLLQHKGVHHYVQRLAHPELYALKETEAVPEALYTPVIFSSSYMVRNMHDYYNEEREKAGLPSLYYKMAATNPRNPVNQANAFESELIEMFNQDKSITRYNKILEIDGQKQLYVAIPFLRNEDRCLKCHGDFEDSPLQLQALYPDKGGFDEEIGYIRAIESLSAPLTGELAISYIALLSAAVVGIAIMGLLLLNRRLGFLVENRTSVIKSQARSLKESEENLRITLDSIGDAVIATDTEGRIVRMNPVAEHLTGWSGGDAGGQLLEDVFHIVNAGTRLACESPVRKVMRTGEIVGLDNHTVLIAKDGVERQIADSGAPILDDRGTTVGVVLVFRDVTEQYAMESRLQQSQKMDAVGQLAGGIAHDFNNMLGGIIGSTELLQMNLKENEESNKYIEILLAAADRASDLTGKLLAFSRKSTIESVTIDAHVAVKDAVTLLSHTLDKRVCIHTNLAAERSTVVGDVAQLQNVFLNLGINAGDAMQGAGNLSFSSRVVVLDDAFCNASTFDIAPGPYIMVEVRDTGEGIPADKLQRVFEPFFTTKPTGKGTGLGLAAAFGIIEQHKGSITVYSEEGNGTVFHIALPLATSEAATLQSEPEAVRGTGVILVVDDEESIRATAQGILTNLGYDVITAENGRQAIDVYKENRDRVDLILLDMVMPEMNGRECFEKLRSIQPDIRVVISSGFADGADITALKQQGITDFIRKPYQTVALSRVVASAMD